MKVRRARSSRRLWSARAITTADAIDAAPPDGRGTPQDAAIRGPVWVMSAWTRMVGDVGLEPTTR